jgi:lipoate-protein ligase A
MYQELFVLALVRPAMQKTIHGSLTVPEGIARDEEALSKGEIHVQVARCKTLTLSLGVSQSLESREARRAREMGVPVFKRTSGGTGLLHCPGDIFWSVVLPRDSQWVGRDFIHRYSHFGAGWVDFLSRRRLTASWIKAPDGFPSYCLFSGRGEVLATGGRVLGGASQHVTSKALLHHGTVACTLDSVVIEEVFGMPKELTKGLSSLEDEGVKVDEGDLGELAQCLYEAMAGRPW